MRYLELSRIKEHLNIDKDFTDDDLYLESLGDVAEQMVERHLECNLDEFDNSNVPAPVLHACLLLVGNLYNNRESVSNTSQHELPLSYRYLLATYKNYSHSRI